MWFVGLLLVLSVSNGLLNLSRLGHYVFFVALVGCLCVFIVAAHIVFSACEY